MGAFISMIAGPLFQGAELLLKGGESLLKAGEGVIESITHNLTTLPFN